MLTALLASAGPAVAEPPRIDLDQQAARQTIVDREPGVYLGHVSTVLLDDAQTILAAYPQGHGRGPIILKRSDDGGLSWSGRLPTPRSWATSQETPTLFRTGDDSLILFSGLHPIRAARSSDAGRTWTDLEPIGDFGGIVAMGGVADLGDGRLAAFFHDDGRFIAPAGRAAGVFTLYQTDSSDGGATWSAPRTLWTGSDVHLCEPGLARSPDGATLALLLRENRRAKHSHVMFSTDRAATWTIPRELPAYLTGDRHIAVNTPGGRLVITFRCMRADDPWRGDWVAWIGPWGVIHDDAPPADPGVLVRLKDNLTDWDCGYAGLELLADGTLVATTYGTWTRGEAPYILSVRFTLPEVDAAIAPGP